MAEHEEYLFLISARLDGAVSSEEESRLEEHLKECPDCRRAEEELRLLQEELRALPRLTPPVDLRDRVMAAAAAEQVVCFPKKKKKTEWKKLLATAAVVMVMVGAASVLQQWTGINGNSSSAPASAEGGAGTTDSGAMEAKDEATSQEAAAAPAENLEPTAAPAGGAEEYAFVGTGGGTPNGRIGANITSDAPQNDEADPGAYYAPAPLQEMPVEVEGSSGSFPIQDRKEGVSSGANRITPREALEIAVNQINAETDVVFTSNYEEENLSCANSVVDSGVLLNTVTFEGTSEDGALYLFLVTFPEEEREFIYGVSQDGSYGCEVVSK